MNNHDKRPLLIYDGECPICSYAATVIRLRESVGALEIINARKNHQLVEEAKKQGYDYCSCRSNSGHPQQCIFNTLKKKFHF